MTRNLLLAAALMMGAMPAMAQTPAEQLQRAIFTQDSQGNVDAAIATYRQLSYSGLTPRDVAAQAQYRLAQALLVKGDVSAATREFERLERDFADYQKLVANLAARSSTGPMAANALPAAFPREVAALVSEARGSRFDGGAPISFSGKVVQVSWVNPRSVVVVDSGAQKYVAQITSPNSMVQQGLTRTSLALGQEIVVQAIRPNQGRLVWENTEVVQANVISSADGKVLFDWSKVPEAVRAPIEPK